MSCFLCNDYTESEQDMIYICEECKQIEIENFRNEFKKIKKDHIIYGELHKKANELKNKGVPLKDAVYKCLFGNAKIFMLHEIQDEVCEVYNKGLEE